MLFSPTRHRHMWDTWCYHDGKLLHLFYLFMEDFVSPGDGVGHATSVDGVHWEEHPDVILKSPDMDWLGSGAVWRVGDDFVMNYSQMNYDGVQTIYFATSLDLFTWETQPGELPVDPRWYNDTATGRWDCISPFRLEDGTWHGFLTANPWTQRESADGTAERSIGHVVSTDGLNWQGAEPPSFAWGDVAESSMTRMTEVGALRLVDGRYRLMLCSFGFEGDVCGAYGFSAPAIEGPYSPDPGNNRLLFSPRQAMAYFPRFFDWDGESLVNHHSVARDGGRSFSLLKTSYVTEDRLTFGYWMGNEALKGEPVAVELVAASAIGEGDVSAAGDLTIESRSGSSVLVSAADTSAFILEVTVEVACPAGGFGAAGIHIGTTEGGVQINLQTHGQTAYFDTGKEPIVHQLSAGAVGNETVEKGIAGGREHHLRVIAIDGYIETYLDNELLHVYSAPGQVDGRIRFSAADGKARFSHAQRWAVVDRREEPGSSS